MWGGVDFWGLGWWGGNFLVRSLLGGKVEVPVHCPTMAKELDSVKTKISKNAKYRSFTINAVMLSADEVLEKYARAGQIKGLISL